MTSLADRLEQALESAGDKWSLGDKERAVRVMADLVELHSRAALGENVSGAQKMVVATIAQITSTSSRHARSVIRRVVDEVIGIATAAVLKGLT